MPKYKEPLFVFCEEYVPGEIQSGQPSLTSSDNFLYERVHLVALSAVF